MDTIKSCGVIVFRNHPQKSFLLMQHPDRWDFPKGHVDPGESDVECALRELVEETGIGDQQIELNQQFRFSLTYTIHVKKFNFEPRAKSLTLFLGHLRENVDITPTEHVGFRWVNWDPPHQIQLRTVDPALHAIETFWKDHPDQEAAG